MHYPLHPDYQIELAIEQAIERASGPTRPLIRKVPFSNFWVVAKPNVKEVLRRPPKRPLWDRIDDLENRLEELERQTKKT